MSIIKMRLIVRDKDKLLEAMQEAKSRVRPLLYRAVRDSMVLVLRQIESNLNGIILRTRTGRLKGSFLTETNVTDKAVYGTIGSNVKYAAIHEFGGVIRARPGGFLVFKIGSNWIKKRQVIMPARRYFSRSFEEVSSEVESVMEKVLTEILFGK